MSVLGLIVRSPGCDAPAEAVIRIDAVDFFFHCHVLSSGSVKAKNVEEKPRVYPLIGFFNLSVNTQLSRGSNSENKN